MNAYVYRAALYSGAGLIAVLMREGRAAPAAADMDVEDVLDQIAGAEGVDRDDKSSYDTDDFPAGPYEDGGGEADYPAHCDETLAMLNNPLTQAGYAYMREAFDYLPAIEPGDSDYLLADRLARRLDRTHPPLAAWARFYPEAFDKANGGPL